MNKILLGSLFFFCSVSVANASSLRTLTDVIKNWEPKAVELDENDIDVTMNTNHVTWDIYRSVVSLGVCGPLWTHEGGNNYLKSLKNINFMNLFNMQGYVLENPRKACEELGHTKDDKVNIVIGKYTHGIHTHADTSNE